MDRTLHWRIEREEYIEDAGVEIIEEPSTEEMLIQFWEMANEVVAMIPETRECGEERYGV